MTVIDLDAERAKRDGPDAEFVYRDDAGVQWSVYAFSYSTEDGREFSFHLWATSYEDAESRLEALRSTARLDGRIHKVIYL